MVIASSGRTDANGCHNSKTEGYHCHRSQTSSSSSSSIPSSTIPTSTLPTSPQGINLIGEHCDSNSECRSNFCVHNLCQSQSYYIGDKFCDKEESCVNSPNDCGTCKNNGNCEIEINETCENSNDCVCTASQICALDRNNKNSNGCYDIRCGDELIDYGETVSTCCLDVKCPPTKSLIKENYCNQNSKSCDAKVKGWLKITGGLVAAFLVLLLYNRISVKKTHRHK